MSMCVQTVDWFCVCKVCVVVLAALIEPPVPLLHYATLRPHYWEPPKFLICAPSTFLSLCQENKQEDSYSLGGHTALSDA